MSHPSPPPSAPRTSPRLSLPHTSDQLFAAATLALATVATVLSFAGVHAAGALVAAACVGVGGWSQLVSTTTAERFVTVFATVTGATALAICLAKLS